MTTAFHPKPVSAQSGSRSRVFFCYLLAAVLLIAAVAKGVALARGDDAPLFGASFYVVGVLVNLITILTLVAAPRSRAVWLGGGVLFAGMAMWSLYALHLGKSCGCFGSLGVSPAATALFCAVASFILLSFPPRM